MQNINLNYKYVCFAIALLFFAIPGLNAQEIFFIGDADAEIPESDAGLYQDELQPLEPDEQIESNSLLESSLGSLFASRRNSSSSSIQLRGGGGDATAYFIDLSIPIADSFCFSLHAGQFCHMDRTFHSWEWRSHTYYTYWYSYRSGYHTHVHRYWTKRYYSYTLDQKSALTSAIVTWMPLNKALISPYIGAGCRYEDTWIDDDIPDDNFGFVGKIGLALNLSPVTLKIEYIKGPDVIEKIFDVSMEMGDSCKIHLFVEDLDPGSPDYDGLKPDPTTKKCYGGGLEFSF